MIERGIYIKKSKKFSLLADKYPDRFIVEVADEGIKVIDTFIDKTKDELEVDVLVLWCRNGNIKKVYILKDGISMASYLEYFTLRMKNAQGHSMIRHRLLDDNNLPLPFFYTFETFESIQDIFLKKPSYKNLSTCIVKVVEPKRIVAKHNTRELPKMEFFQYNASRKRKLNPKCKFLNKVFQLVRETGVLIVGSYPLSLIKKDRFEPDDIDIFSHSLAFLRALLKFILCSDRTISLYCIKLKRFYRIDSYKMIIKTRKRSENINFIHLGDNCEPEDLKLSQEEDRQKTKEFICDKFDISACITCYDGEYLHYNKSINDDLMECRYSTNSRINKYLSRGFTSKETIHTTKSEHGPILLYENDETINTD